MKSRYSSWRSASYHCSSLFGYLNTYIETSHRLDKFLPLKNTHAISSEGNRSCMHMSEGKSWPLAEYVQQWFFPITIITFSVLCLIQQDHHRASFHHSPSLHEQSPQLHTISLCQAQTIPGCPVYLLEVVGLL